MKQRFPLKQRRPRELQRRGGHLEEGARVGETAGGGVIARRAALRGGQAAPPPLRRRPPPLTSAR